MSMKNCSDTIGNRTRDLPACSAVPQPTTPPRAPAKKLSASQKEIFSMEFDADMVTRTFFHISAKSWACNLVTAGERDDLQVLWRVQVKQNDKHWLRPSSAQKLSNSKLLPTLGIERRVATTRLADGQPALQYVTRTGDFNLQAPCFLYIRTGVSLLSRERFLYI